MKSPTVMAVPTQAGWVCAASAKVTYPDWVESDPVKVFVVDDHALHRDGTRRILEQHPCIEVVGDSESAEIALSRLASTRPGVVLMDVRLPGISGIEATRRIRRDHPDIAVLVVTAHDEAEYVRGALEAGAAGFLSKASPGRELIDAVLSVASGRSVLEARFLGTLVAPAGSSTAPGANLTDREMDVLSLLAVGLHNKQVARRLAISTRTVDRHCDSIYTKLGVTSRTEAVVKALRRGLVTVPGD